MMCRDDAAQRYYWLGLKKAGGNNTAQKISNSYMELDEILKHVLLNTRQLKHMLRARSLMNLNLNLNLKLA